MCRGQIVHFMWKGVRVCKSVLGRGNSSLGFECSGFGFDGFELDGFVGNGFGINGFGFSGFGRKVVIC